MIGRGRAMDRLRNAVARSPVTALLGPRQVGKTTLARQFAGDLDSTYFDLEYEPDARRLDNADLALRTLGGLVVLDEVQVRPDLLPLLRVLSDRTDTDTRFLVLGSASSSLVSGASESLAGRIAFVELSGFDVDEVGSDSWHELWVRGGFPRSYLTDSEPHSVAWREDFVRTFLERDIPSLGIRVAPPAMRRFWTMLAHYHGQTWNGSKIGRAMGLADVTVRSYLDILTGTYMVRQLQPWHANLRKRQVKSPKVYLRDSGILHSLLSLPDKHSLMGHPSVGASWEGFALEQTLLALGQPTAYFWGTHGGAELDLLWFAGGKPFGVELKFNEAPTVTKSMRVALADLDLTHLWVVHPGPNTHPMTDRITAVSIGDVAAMATQVAEMQP